jgi:hypothetical protein
VDRRGEQRFTANMPVLVTVLGAVKQPAIEGRFEDMSGSGLSFRVPLPIPCGALVKVEGNDTVLLGEVCRSQPAQDGYEVALEVSHAVASVSSLERFHRSLLGKNKVSRRRGTKVS